MGLEHVLVLCHYTRSRKKNQVRVVPFFLCPLSDMTTGDRDLRNPSLPAVSPIHRGAGQGEGDWQGVSQQG